MDVLKTRHKAFASLAGIVMDLGQTLEPEQRYQRLLEALHANFPCDAIALLQHEGDVLVPRAVKGLSPDTLGRRFELAHQPRLQQILHSRDPVRFPADSAFPDPYDGLVEHSHGEHLYVHDCMGIALYVDDCPWGVLTLDALTPGTFDAIDDEILTAFVAVAAATVRVADWIHRLESQLERHHRVNRSLSDDGLPSELIGDHPLMKQLRREAETVASSDLPVLIMGETGVGKELVAKLVHRHSGRVEEPMVHVNCAALPESLAESELFGHVRGAFSGATDERMGKFELAHEGTLFLDEVGELPLAVQAKLLRALQDGEIQRLGSDHLHRVNVRLIAATNRDLKQEVVEGRFRADLYHRLSVYPLLVPSLRERGDDVVQLAGYFLERSQRQLGLRGVRLSRSARQWLTQYDWPGNVRELEHMLSRALVKALSEGHRRDVLLELTSMHLATQELARMHPGNGLSSAALDNTLLPTLTEALDDYRRQLVEQRLKHYDGNQSLAARSLGMDRGNFHRLLKRLGLK